MVKTSKKTFLVVISALLLPLIFAGCSSQVGSSEGQVDSSESSTANVDAAPTNFGVGDTIEQEDFNIKLNSVTKVTKGMLGTKPDNDFFIVIDATIENKSSDDLSSSSIMSFELKGSDDYTYDQSITVDKKGSLDGTVAAGSKLRGQIAYDVSNLESYELSFKPGLFGDPVFFTIKSTDIK